MLQSRFLSRCTNFSDSLKTNDLTHTQPACLTSHSQETLTKGHLCQSTVSKNCWLPINSIPFTVIKAGLWWLPLGQRSVFPQAVQPAGQIGWCQAGIKFSSMDIWAKWLGGWEWVFWGPLSSLKDGSDCSVFYLYICAGSNLGRLCKREMSFLLDHYTPLWIKILKYWPHSVQYPSKDLSCSTWMHMTK